MGPLTEDDWAPVFKQSKYIYPLDSDGIDIVASLSRYCKTKCQSIVVVFGTRLEARVFVDTYAQRMDLGHITTLCTRERVGSVTQLYDVVVYYNARLPRARCRVIGLPARISARVGVQGRLQQKNWQGGGWMNSMAPQWEWCMYAANVL